MELLAYSAGVDISADDFDACIEGVYDTRATKVIATRKFKNTAVGFKQFDKWLFRKAKQKTLLQVGMEATGRYHEGLAYYLFAAGYRISVILPNKIKHFAYSVNQYSKNDALDASLIAAYVSKHVPGAWQPISESMRDLRELSRERQALIKQRTQTKNRLKALKAGYAPLKKTVARLTEQVDFLNRQLKQVDAEMAQITERDETLSDNFNLLVSIPHIGAVSAYTIMAETDCFNLFVNRNQLIKYAGLDVIEKQSGSSVRGRTKISKRGNAHLRSAPYAGLNAIMRTQSVFVDTYTAALERGMHPKQARTAVVRQLLRVAFGVVKSGRPYCEANHRNRSAKEVGEHSGSPTVTDSVA